jgi:hypothetical protein
MDDDIMTNTGPTSRVVPDSIIGELTASPESHPVFRVDDPQLRFLAQRLRPLLEAAEKDSERAPLDYLLGGLHALFRARQLGFVDRPEPLDNAYWRGPLRRVKYMESGDIRTDGKWLAGFYFNAALARIAAGFERIVALIEERAQRRTGGKFWKRLERLDWGNWSDPDFVLKSGEASKAYRVYAEVNFLKHDPKGRAEGRNASIGDAITAFGETIDLIERRVSLGVPAADEPGAPM